MNKGHGIISLHLLANMMLFIMNIMEFVDLCQTPCRSVLIRPV